MLFRLPIFSSHPTFYQLAEEWQRQAASHLRPAWHRECARLLAVEINPRIGSCRADKLTLRQIAVALEQVTSPNTRRNAGSVIRCVYRWAIATGRLDDDPTTALRFAPSRTRERILTPEELRLVWQASADLADYGRIVRLLILLGQRRGEIGSLEWSEVNLEQRQIELPASRTKAKRAHIVPLTELALEQLPGRREGYPHVFGRLPGAGFSGWSKGRVQLNERLGDIPPFCLHDLRRTAATGMGDLGIADDIITRVLNHAPSGVTRMRYNRAQRLVEQRAALEIWSEEVARIVGCYRPVRGGANS